MSLDDFVKPFRGLPEPDRQRIHEFSGVKSISLYALSLSHKLHFERASPSQLSFALEELGVSLSPEQIRKSLTASKGLVSVRRQRGGNTYRLMQPGYDFLDLAASGWSVVRIEGGKPLTARQSLTTILANLTGIIRISDPYYGQRTVGVLAELQKSKEVRFLTHKVGGGENDAAVKGGMHDLMKELPAITIRLVPTLHSISHDRFVLTDRELILIGHGLKDFGARDSFVISLPSEYVTGIADQIRSDFDDQWSKASPL